MHLSAFEQLIGEQLDILDWPLDRSLFVVGPPGSGKTILAVQRAQSLKEMQLDPLIVTYNRMLRRLLELLSDGAVDARTMHSFIAQDYKARTGVMPPSQRYDSYDYLWDNMFERLEKKSTSPNREHLIVDEGQDLPPGFFVYASRYIAKALTIFTDEDQALNRQGTTIEQIKEAAGLDDPIMLSQNHRNTPEVSRFAEHFHSGRLPAALVRRSISGDLPSLVRSQDIGSTVQLVSNWCEVRGGSIGVIVYSNEFGEKLHTRLVQRFAGRRVDRYTNELKNEGTINISQDGITVLNKESSKGQEFDTVFILELDRFLPCSSDVQRRSMYMMCTRARDDLFLVHGPGDLSKAAMAALPGPEIMERS